MSVCCDCCQVEVSANGWSLIQRSPTECDVSEYDREASIMMPRPTRGCCDMEKKTLLHIRKVPGSNPVHSLLSTLYGFSRSVLKLVITAYTHISQIIVRFQAIQSELLIASLYKQ
jgi:hypothetical protein